MLRSMAPITRRARASIASVAKRGLGGSLLIVTSVWLAMAASARASPPGNTLNPTGLEPSRPIDERGMTLLQDASRRSPGGSLYPHPLEPQTYSPLGSWLYSGYAEIGVFWDGGDEDQAYFEKYSDWTDDAFANFLHLDLLNPRSGWYLEFNGGGVGRDDQFYSLDAGRVGWLRLRGSFTQIPHLLARDATVIFEGLGGDSLRLPAGLTPGANSEADLDAALATTGQSTIKTKRDRTRIALDLKLRPDLNLFAGYDFVSRRGERAYGGAFSFPPVGSTFGGVVESAEPVDQHTHNVSGGLSYSNEFVEGNVAYYGSFFRNQDNALVFENPLRIGAPGSPLIERARFALPPDNDWHNIKGDVAISLPFRSRLTSTVSWGTMRQDDDLLPPTVNSVVIPGGPFTVDLGNWNTTAALSQTQSDARIDTLLVDTALYLNPWKPLRFKARLRYYDQDNDTDYTALNPQTGEYGYIVEDGGEAVVIPRVNGVYVDAPGFPGGKWKIRSVPYGHTRTDYELGVTYRPVAHTTLELRFGHQVIDRDYRQRDRTREDRIELDLTTRRLSWATLHLAYEYAGRDGGSYDLNVLDPFFTTSLPGYTPPPPGDSPAGLRQLRRDDLANRRQQIFDARVNFLIGDTMDLHLSGRYRSDDYRGSDYGLRWQRTGSMNLEWNFQPSARTDVYLFGSVERRHSEISNIRGDLAGSDPDAGGAVYPFVNAWDLDSDSWSVGFGAGGGVTLRPGLSLEVDYSLVDTREEVDYAFNSAGALAGSVSPAQAGTSFPDLRTQDQILETSLRWAFSERLAARLYYRYQRATIRNWLQRDLVPLDDQRLFFAHIDESYEVSIYGVTLQLSF